MLSVWGPAHPDVGRPEGRQVGTGNICTLKVLLGHSWP